MVFNLDFSALNTTYTSTLIVPEGKEIMADIQCDGGRIDVTITPEDGEPIYTGKRLPTSSFSIVPKTPGKYTVTISGETPAGMRMCTSRVQFTMMTNQRRINNRQ